MATIDELRRGINQYEAGTGRRISPDVLQALLQAQLQVDSDRQVQNKSLELKERALESDIKERKAAAEAAKFSGVAQLGESAIIGGQLLKDTKLGKAIGSSVSGLFGGGTAASAGVGSTATLLGGAGAGAGSTATLLGGTGAESLLGASGTAATGAGGYSLLGGTGAESLIGSSAVEGAAAGAPAAAGSSLFGTLAPPALGATGGRILADVLFGGDSTAKDIGTIGGAAGIGFFVGGPVGAVVGAGIGVVGDFIADSVGTVICSELCRQGYIPEGILALDSEHRKRFIDDQTYSGYLKWAIPVVRMMKKSKMVTQIIRPFGVAWAYEMAHRINPEIKGRFLGKALLKIGVPICSYLGKKESEYASA